MFLSDLALIGIIQLIVLLTGGVFFLLLHVRFLKKQIRSLKADRSGTKPYLQQQQQIAEQSDTQILTETRLPDATLQQTEHTAAANTAKEIPGSTEPVQAEPAPAPPPALDRPTTQDIRPARDTSANKQTASAAPQSVTPAIDDEMPGEIAELIKMLNEELLLTANMRELIESLDSNPDQVKEILAHQNSTLVHLEQYIHLSQDEAEAIEIKIHHYRDQIIKLKKRLAKAKAGTSAASKPAPTPPPAS